MFLPPPPRLTLLPRSLISNPFLLKARKNFDIPTDCIYLLNSEKYKKFSPKTIKLLLSQHAKKKPFGKMSLGTKIPTKTKTIGRNVTKFSYFTENPGNQKPERKLLKLIASSYKHLKHLNVGSIDIQDKSSLSSISKLNHLQSLNIKLHVAKPMPSPRFFQNLKHLRHLTLSVTESAQNKETDLAALAGFLYNMTLLPSLESYSMDICTAFSEQSENFVGTVFYYLDLLKAKQFSVKVRCSEEIDLKVEMFSSFLESVDTLELKYFGSATSLKDHFQASPSKKLVLLLNPSQRKQSFTSLINACISLENLYIEQRKTTTSPALNLPQTPKALVLAVPSPQLPKTFKFWEDMLSSLKDLESLTLLLKNPDVITQEWTSQLPKRASLKSLKRYQLKLEGDTTLQPGVKLEYDSFLTEWSRGIQSLSSLESLSFDTTFVLLKSLDFFTEAMTSLSKLKSIKINLLLHYSQPKETLMFHLPPQNLSSLEDIWLNVSQYLSKDSAAKLLQDIASCENLQSFNVSGLAFEEETALSTLKGFPQLRELEIETDTRSFLTINSKKEIIKHKARFFKRRMANLL